MHVSGETSWQARISVAAKSRIRSVTERRIVGQDSIKSVFSILAHANGRKQRRVFKQQNCAEWDTAWYSDRAYSRNRGVAALAVASRNKVTGQQRGAWSAS